jgi:small subunit ribosomal protein S3
MIERKFIEDKVKEHQIKEFLKTRLAGTGYSRSEIQKTPLGVRIVIYSSKPGLIVGRKGLNIQQITSILKEKFKLENPSVEVRQVEIPELDPQIMAERIATQISRFGVQRFKAIGHKNLARIMNAGAIGVEIKIAGKVPGKRAKYWKFRQGYLPKCGHASYTQVKEGFVGVMLKPGVVGVTVKILPPGARMPDSIELKEREEEEGELPEEELKQMEGERWR